MGEEGGRKDVMKVGRSYRGREKGREKRRKRWEEGKKEGIIS